MKQRLNETFIIKPCEDCDANPKPKGVQRSVFALRDILADLRPPRLGAAPRQCSPALVLSCPTTLEGAMHQFLSYLLGQCIVQYLASRLVSGHGMTWGVVLRYDL